MIHVTDVMPETSALWTREFIFTAPRPVMSLNEIYELLPEIATVSHSSRVLAARMESGGFIEVTAPYYTGSHGVMVVRTGVFTNDEKSDDAKLWSLVSCGPDYLGSGMAPLLFNQGHARSLVLAKLRAESEDPVSFCPEVKGNIDHWISNALIEYFIGTGNEGVASTPPLTAKTEALKHLLISELRSQPSPDGALERAITLAKAVEAAFDTLTD